MDREDAKPKLNVLWGARAIGEAINATERQTYHLLENGLIPGRKIGERWTSEENQLRKHWTGKAESEAGA